MIVALSILLIALILVAITQYLKTSELKSYFNNEGIVYLPSVSQSKIQATLLAFFFPLYLLLFLIQIWVWGPLTLPTSGSIHGDDYDFMMNLTLWIISIVFVLSHLVLAFFCFKYSYNPNRKALFFAHSNKLEFIWTTVPSLALAVIITLGLIQWNNVMTPISNQDHELIEVYARQFDWTVRYSGKDNKLGNANFTYITGDNPLGLDIADPYSKDDKIVKGEFHIPVGKPIQFLFRSQDVIHSAYMPHFRAQMNCVPGITTEFNFTPKYTSNKMKEITSNPDFEYILLCNKICGAAHYNMQMKIVVDTPLDYEKWLSKQQEFTAKN